MKLLPRIQVKELTLDGDRQWTRCAELVLAGWKVEVQVPAAQGMRVLLVRRRSLWERFREGMGAATKKPATVVYRPH